MAGQKLRADLIPEEMTTSESLPHISVLFIPTSVTPYYLFWNNCLEIGCFKQTNKTTLKLNELTAPVYHTVQETFCISTTGNEREDRNKWSDANRKFLH